MSINQNDLFNFYYIIKSQSITKAADKLQVSKGYLSKSLQRLEQDLDTKLIYRSTRKIAPTTAGEQLYKTASNMQQELQFGLNSLQTLSNKPRGELKISAPPSFSEYCLAPLLSKFMQLNPEIKINLQLESNLVDVLSGKYDLVIRSAKLPDSNLIARKLCNRKNVIVASNEFIKKHGSPKNPEDLQNFPCIAYKSTGKIIWNFKDSKKNQSITIDPKLTSNLSSMLKEFALEGSGITLLPLFAADKEIKSGKLKVILANWKLPEAPLYILYPSRDYIPLKTKAMIDFLINALKN